MVEAGLTTSDTSRINGRSQPPAYPNLAGQYETYLKLQLELFRRNARGGSPFARWMHPIAKRLEPHHIERVARYYASLSADRFDRLDFAGWEVCGAE